LRAHLIAHLRAHLIAHLRAHLIAYLREERRSLPQDSCLVKQQNDS